MITIAVDCMGGDHGPQVTLPACRNFWSSIAEASLILVGLPSPLVPAFRTERARMVVASEVVTMDDPLEIALRRKKDSSMRVAIQQVKEGKCASRGFRWQYGCFDGHFTLHSQNHGWHRAPRHCGSNPQCYGRCHHVLDLGANVDCTAEHLACSSLSWARRWFRCLSNKEPTVGLLNIGEEIIKGNETIKKAGELLRSAAKAGDLNFFGNVEGNDIFKGTVDLVVCDGFVGNVALKTSEGLAAMIGGFLKAEFSAMFSPKWLQLLLTRS
jgi:glycerol-3-phosphate acyltransferase PlsX